MASNCSRCGAFNRSTAKFCQVCGNTLSQAIMPSSLHSASLRTPIPSPASTAPQPQTPIRTQGSTARKRVGFFRRGPTVEGRVNVVDLERQEKSPFDPARTMVMLSFLVVLLGIFLGIAAAGMAIVVILLILGVGIGFLGCLAGLVLLPLKMVLSPAINFIRGDPSVTVLNFQVIDTVSGMPVDVLLYRKPGGGNVRLGDFVIVYGSKQRGNNVIRALRIQIIESGGRATDYKIDAIKPWPIWIGFLILGLAAAGAMLMMGML